MTADPPGSVPPHCRRRRRWWCLVPGMCRLLWYGLLLIVITGGILWGIGLPSPWSQRLLHARWAPARDLQVERIRIHPVRGVLLEGISLAMEPGRPPAATARRLILRPEFTLTNHTLRAAIREVGIQEGTLRLTPDDREPVEITRIIGNLLIEPETLVIRQATATLKGIQLRATGEIPLIPAGTTPEVNFSEVWSNLIAQTPHWVADLPLHEISASPDSPPELTLRFTPTIDSPAKLAFTMVGQADGITYGGRAIDRLTLLADASADQVAVSTIELLMGKQRFHASGSWRAETGEVEAHVFTDLPPQRWISLLPTAWKTNTLFSKLDMDGSFTTEWWIGPCPAATWGTHWNGWLSADQVTFGTLPISRGFLSARRRGPVIDIEQALFQAGEGEGKGRIEAQAMIDFSDQTLQGTGFFDLDLRQAESLIPRPLAKVARDFEYRDRPIRFQCGFRSSLTHLDYEVTGELTGSSFSFRDVPIDQMTCSLTVRPGLVALAPLTFSKDRGSLTGDLRLHFNPNRYEIDLEGTAHPLQSLAMANRRLSEQLSIFDLKGSSLVKVKGLVHENEPTLSNLKVSVSASDVGLDWFRADKVLGDWYYTGDQVRSSNLVIQAYGGSLTGAIHWIEGAPSHTEVRLTGEQIAFNRLISDRRKILFDRDVGEINLRLNLDLPGNDPHLEQMTGDGRIAIRNGSLMQVPIFGGLSVLLSAIYPGLGYSDQSSFIADFTIADHQIRTDNAALSGNIISLTARGTYDLDDQLDFAVQVKPLKGGVIADTLRLVTMPISKLLEFDLTGHTTNAQWRASNLPRLGVSEEAPP